MLTPHAPDNHLPRMATRVSKSPGPRFPPRKRSLTGIWKPTVAPKKKREAHNWTGATCLHASRATGWVQKAAPTPKMPRSKVEYSPSESHAAQTPPPMSTSRISSSLRSSTAVRSLCGHLPIRVPRAGEKASTTKKQATEKRDTIKLASSGRQIVHALQSPSASAPLPSSSSASSLSTDSMLSRIRENTSSIIAAAVINCPSGVLSRFISVIILIVNPIAVEESAMPLASAE
mmetsp:Transcript_25627/g.58656  ORF Transcript_25627/g.58656 Transcript_25627/m.58656 type:complete len:232 (+) Transcript_25627:371-1066(+)